MPAQPGHAVLLGYGPQGTQQPGTGVLLDYAPAITGRKLVVNTLAKWSSVSGDTDGLLAARYADAEQVDRVVDAPWTMRAGLEPSAIDAAWGKAEKRDAGAVVPWSIYAGRVVTEAEASYAKSVGIDTGDALPWGLYSTRMAGDFAAVYVIRYPLDDMDALPWGSYRRLGEDFTARHPAAIRACRLVTAPFGRYWRLDTGSGVIVEPGGPPTDENGTIIVPVRGVYIVLNQVTLTRVADSQALDCLSLSINLDAESWVCGFDASLPGNMLDGVIGSAGSPVELEASINGIVFRLLAERISRDRSFGKARIAISGRGIAAVLDDPYAPSMSFASANAITAQQAAEAAITAAGLPTGWTLDWQLTDWLLPAGLWRHQGSPVSAVTRIAQAAGGYVQADAYTKTLHVLHRYPVKPWEWGTATPDIELPAAVAVTEGLEWEDKPAYNAVYVSGSVGGVLNRVKRAGTAGDLVAQMVTDDLITHADAGRQRGIAILGDTGRQARVSLSLPVLAETGIILPGQLVRYVDGATTRIGIVRGVSVSAALPKVRQTVELETHV